jgi:hypothetical protein
MFFDLLVTRELPRTGFKISPLALARRNPTPIVIFLNKKTAHQVLTHRRKDDTLVKLRQ